MSWVRFKLLIKNVLYVHQITFVILNLTNWTDALLTQYQYYICVSFLLFDRKHLEKVLKKSWSTITLGWFVFALLLASRLLLLGKQTMWWGGGQNSLSGLHVHASTNQFFLPGTNAKRLEYRLYIVDSFIIVSFICFFPGIADSI